MSKAKKTELYCGNNKRDPRSKNAGTPRACFKKGFGAGYNSPVDTAFKGPYSPLMVNKLHCGSRPPRGKVRATLGQCAQMGWGAGAAKRANETKPMRRSAKRATSAFLEGGAPTEESESHTSFNLDLPLIVVALLVGEFAVLYWGQPKFIMTKDSDGKDVLDWRKLLIVFGVEAAIIIFILLFLI